MTKQIINSSGRRKTSVARAYFANGSGEILINGRDYKEYFPTAPMQYKIVQVFKLLETEGTYNVKVNVNGGGLTGQSEATRLAIAKIFADLNADFRKTLKDAGLLTRDDRAVESKKYGRKKARKKFQFSKR